MANSVSSKYRRRINQIPGATYDMVELARRDYKEGLQNATEEELYKRTKYPVTRDMFKSIDAVRVGTHELVIGYIKKVKSSKPYLVTDNDSWTKVGKVRVYKYRKRKTTKTEDYILMRLNMSGTSRVYGYNLKMRPGEYLKKHVDPKIRAANQRMQRRIIGN